MAKIRKSPSHLLRVGTTFHFRYKIPRQYKRFITGEVRVSLGTGFLKVARIKAAKLTSLTQGYLLCIAEGRIVIDEEQKIKVALGQFLRGMLEKHELKMIERSAMGQDSSENGSKLKQGMSIEEIELDISNQLKGEHGRGRIDVIDTLKKFGINGISQDSFAYKYAHRELVKVCQALLKIVNEREKGNYNSILEISILSNYPVQAKSIKEKRKRSKRLSKAIEQFIAENDSDKKWAPNSITEYKNRLTLLPAVIGDCQLSEIDSDKMREFFDKLKRLPPNRSKSKDYREKTISQILEMNLPSDKCMSPQTVKNAFQLKKMQYPYYAHLGVEKSDIGLQNAYVWALKSENALG